VARDARMLKYGREGRFCAGLLSVVSKPNVSARRVALY